MNSIDLYLIGAGALVSALVPFLNFTGLGYAGASSPRWSTQRKIHLAVQICLTIVLVPAALYIVLYKEPCEAKWAYGMIGVLSRFWLRPFATVHPDPPAKRKGAKG